MFRVVTRYNDRFGKSVVERGPWHISREEAEHWAAVLEGLGYWTDIESQRHGGFPAGPADDDLGRALAGMA